MSFVNSDSFTSFSNFNTFFFFFVWLLWLGLPIQCWLQMVRMGILVPSFRRKAYSFHHCNLCCGIVIDGDLLPLYQTWEFFITNKYGILPNAFCTSIEVILLFLSFFLLMWHITLINSWILNHPHILGINPTWSWCMIFLIYCWI